jgi:hypothetical protein
MGSTEPQIGRNLATAFPVMAEEDYMLIGIAIASTLCLVVSYGL